MSRQYQGNWLIIMVNWNTGASGWIFQILNPKMGIFRAVFIKSTGLRPKSLSPLCCNSGAADTQQWQKNGQLQISPNSKCYGIRCLISGRAGNFGSSCETTDFQKSCCTKVQNLKFAVSQLRFLFSFFSLFQQKKKHWETKLKKLSFYQTTLQNMKPIHIE